MTWISRIVGVFVMVGQFRICVFVPNGLTVLDSEISNAKFFNDFDDRRSCNFDGTSLKLCDFTFLACRLALLSMFYFSKNIGLYTFRFAPGDNDFDFNSFNVE